MTDQKSAVVIGAGVGGITTAIFLARRGFKVDIYEKNASAGGRCGHLVKDGHRFDTGATFLMMPEVYERIWNSFDKDVWQELDLVEMDPIYRLKFNNGREILFRPDLVSLREAFESIEPGSFRKFLRLLPRGYTAYRQSMKHIVDHNYLTLFDPALFKQLFLLLKFRALANHYRYISRHFKTEELRSLFTFQNLYLGQDPLRSSSIYFFMPFMELTSGVYFPRGGMHRIIENLVGHAESHGVSIHLNTAVNEIRTGNKRAEGVVLKNGEVHHADVVIANADVPYVYNNLLPDSRKGRKLNRLKFTCSAMAFHWGLDKAYPGFRQHNVFVAGNHRKNFDTIFRDKSLPDEPTIYIHSPVNSDPEAAPEGQDSITAIVHAGHVDPQKPQEYKDLRERARQAILKRLAEEGMDDFEEHIKFEVFHSPKTYQAHFNLTRGAVFGSVGHQILQMGYFRPHNRHNHYKNLYFVGGTTQPGSGMPLSMLSAKLVTERIMKNPDINRNNN